jgi:hypothetical protein
VCVWRVFGGREVWCVCVCDTPISSFLKRDLDTRIKTFNFGFIFFCYKEICLLSFVRCRGGGLCCVCVRGVGGGRGGHFWYF